MAPRSYRRRGQRVCRRRRGRRTCCRRRRRRSWKKKPSCLAEAEPWLEKRAALEGNIGNLLVNLIMSANEVVSGNRRKELECLLSSLGSRGRAKGRETSRSCTHGILQQSLPAKVQRFARQRPTRKLQAPRVESNKVVGKAQERRNAYYTCPLDLL